VVGILRTDGLRKALNKLSKRLSTFPEVRTDSIIGIYIP